MCANSHGTSTVDLGRGSLLLIGGAEDRAGDCVLLRVFTELSGCANARIALITTASSAPGDSFAEYAAAFRGLGVRDIRELRISGREQANGQPALAEISDATGVFLTGGDQARLQPLVRSRVNLLMRDRLADDTLIVAGTSAGATALGSVMILGGDRRGCADGTTGRDANDGWPRTGPGLGLAPGLIVDMHFTQRQRLPRLVSAVCRDPSRLGVGIDEDTAIHVRHGRFVVLGRGSVVVVDGCQDPATPPHRLRAGDTFDLERRLSLS